MKKIDKDKTVERILGSPFPVDLLTALSSLDAAMRDLEMDAERAGGDGDVAPDIFQKMVEYAVITTSEFRNVWAVYAEEEKEPKKKTKKKTKNETVQTKTD